MNLSCISVIIPTYNEDEVIEETIKELKKYGIKQIIVVDGGSKDNTFQEGLAMCLDPLTTFGVKQIPESSQEGVGLSWNDFKKAAKGNKVKGGFLKQIGGFFGKLFKTKSLYNLDF